MLGFAAKFCNFIGHKNFEDAAAAGKVLWSQVRGPDFTGFNRNATDRSGVCSVPVATTRAIGDVLSSSISSLVVLAYYYFRSAHRQKLNYRKFSP